MASGTAPQLWGGGFSAPPAESLRRLNDSFSFDRQLLVEDVEGSIAWAKALGACGVFTKAEVRKVVFALVEIGAAGIPAAADGHEDVHSYVEAALTDKVGVLAKKLHTGRSRNDQVATDLRLYLRKALVEAKGGALRLAEVLAQRAAAEAGTPMPGYTHLKRAEPVTFGHWCLAYAEMLLRDAARLQQAWERAGECPLGSGALSGTPLDVDREAIAKDLGFTRPTANSLDAVSDRDAAAEYLFDVSLFLVHLSRLAEDVIAFSSDEFAFVALPDALATGSSRMPQKKNPDVLELVRGHAGRSIGELVSLLSLLKGLPLAYDKDLQLDKEPVFRTRATVAVVVPALADLLAGLVLHRDVMAAAAADDRLLATALADALAARGVPFRTAHELVGARIAEAQAAGKTLADLGPSAEISAADLSAVDLGKVLAKRSAIGGTAPSRVKKAAAGARKRIAALGAERRRP